MIRKYVGGGNTPKFILRGHHYYLVTKSRQRYYQKKNKIIDQYL